MFKELKWKYVDTKEKLRETAIIGGIDTGFSWGEITGASVLVLILVAFAVGFVIGPQLGADGATGGPDDPSGAGTSGQSDAVDGGSNPGGSADVGDDDAGDGDGARTDDGGGNEGDGGDGGSDGDSGNVSGAESDGDVDGDAGGSGTETEETTGFDVEAFENAVHGFVNGERRAANRTPLEHASALRDTARTHSDRMASRGVVRHEIPEGVGFEEHFQREGVDRCRTDGNYTGGQNVARSYFETELSGGERFTDEGELAGHVVGSWMSGNGTRRNLLAAGFTAEGIGARYVSSDGAVYVTQHLC